MTCAGCETKIVDGQQYFWGRYGGAWHPTCRAQLDMRGLFSVGMWRNTPEAFRNPDEYTLFVSGLQDGAGI